MHTSSRTLISVSASALIAALALSGCDREPTPKMSSAESVLSTPGTTVAQADTGTAMGTGSVLSDPSMQASQGGMSSPSQGAAGAQQADGSSFDAMTRTEPTSAGAPAHGHAAADDAPVTAATLSRTERDFIAQTGAKSLFEIRVSELAAEKATDPALKSYAAMVAADHKGVSEEIKRLAAGHGVELPQGLAPQDQKTLSALQNASGPAFDKQYLQTVGVNEHEKTIAVYEKAGSDVRNPALKDYVQSTLPTLKAHLDAARKLQTKG